MNAFPRPLSSLLKVAFAAVVLGAPAGCIIVDDTTPAYSQEDFEGTPVSSPAISAYYEKIFAGILCTHTSTAGIDTWQVSVDGTSQSSGQVSCDNASGTPFGVRFEGLAGDTVYTLTATGYDIDGVACWHASCSAHTMPGAHSVLPVCSITKSC
jgi:hypothetical protein